MIVSIYGGQSYAGYMYGIYSLHADHYKVIFLILTKKFMEYLHQDIFCAYTCILMSILITQFLLFNCITCKANEIHDLQE